MSFAPEAYRKMIIDSFDDARHPAYGQVATVDDDQRPKVRTVHFHYIPSPESIVFNTHQSSTKWKELLKHPFASGCYYDLFRLIQFRWEARVELVATDSAKYSNLIHLLWQRMRPDVRRAYWNELGKTNADIEKPAPTIGCVILYPYRWHIYEISSNDFSEGKCTEHELVNNRWKSFPVSLIHGGTINEK